MSTQEKSFKVNCPKCDQPFDVLFFLVDPDAEGNEDVEVECIHCFKHIAITISRKYIEKETTDLVDWGNIQDVAQYISMFLLGLMGDSAYDMARDTIHEMLASIMERFGSLKVREVETRVVKMIKKAGKESSLANGKIGLRIEELFNEFR